MYPNTQEITNVIDFLSYTSFYVETYHDDKRLCYGTAFCYKSKENLFLVSNSHIMSGKCPKLDNNGVRQPILKNGALPNKIKITITAWKDEFGGMIINNKTFKIDLLNEDDSPKYIEAMYKEEIIDIALLKMDETFVNKIDGKRYYPLAVNDIVSDQLNPKYVLHPSSEIFVIGFPFGKLEEDLYGIWKRATIASDLRRDSYKYLIDTSTRSGMSGSPIFRIEQDTKMKLYKGVQELDKEPIFRFCFIGVYSGRIVNNPKYTTEDSSKIEIPEYDLITEAQLGIAWKSSAIDYIIQNASSK